MTTETIVPEFTATPSLRSLIGSVVRLKSGHLGHQAGTKALICGVRSGRYTLELIVPGNPIKFWVQPDDIEIVDAPDPDASWELLSE